jgi:hypothetical protein
MKPSSILFTICLGISNTLFAQDQLEKLQAEMSKVDTAQIKLQRIYEDKILPHGGLFLVGEDNTSNKMLPYNLTTFKYDLRDDLAAVSQASQTFKKSKGQLVTGMVGGYVTINATALGFILARGASSNVAKTVGYSFMSLGLAGVGYSGITYNQGNTNANLAIWQYNRVQFANGMVAANVMTQQEAYALFERKTIRLSLFGCYKNGRYHSTGLFRNGLKQQLGDNQFALKHFREYKVHRSASLLTKALGLTMAIAGKRPTTEEAPTSLFWFGFGIMAFSTVFDVHGQTELARSIWIYNRDALTDATLRN